MTKRVTPIPFGTTVASGMRDPRYAARANLIDVPTRLDKLPKLPFRLRDEWDLFQRVRKAAKREKALLLFSSRGYLKPELLAVASLRLFSPKTIPKIIFYGEMYQANFGLRGYFESLILRWTDKIITRYAVYSEADRELFTQTWGFDPKKVSVCPYYTFHQPNDPSPAMKTKGKHIFAGGNSFRDFAPVIEAARQMPDLTFYLVTTKIEPTPESPPNVKIGPVPFDQYKKLIATAAAVIIPLQTGLNRSTGMLTYLESMWAKNPTIVPDAVGVREYIQHKETGLIVDGRAAGYVNALRWVLADENATKVKEMCERAHDTVLSQFSLEKHVTHLLNIVDQALAA
jgi:glycosyltransferase involved in cell wall biosynthesis